MAVAGDVDGSLAAASASGVWLRRGAGWTRHAVHGEVRDVAFDADGALWIGAARGVWRLDAGGRMEPAHPGAGERDRDVQRLASGAGHIVAAARGGLFLRGPGSGWTHLSEGLPSGSPDAISIRGTGTSEGSFEVWASFGRHLYRIGVEPGGEAPRPARALRVALEGAGGSAVDLAVGPDGRVVALGAGWLAHEEDWVRTRLTLPPGVQARRILYAEGRLRLATDRGLFEAEGGEVGLQRVDAPFGRAAVNGLAAAGRVVFSATAAGLFASGRAVAAPFSLSGLGGLDDPAVRTVQRAALAYLGLGPGRMRELRRGVDRRGWLPRVDLRASHDMERDRSRDRDQTFTSGELREFLDRDESRAREYGLSLTLSWDLGDAAFHPEALDVSREAREVIELRDDVLDEVNRLYFERRRVLAGLASAAGDEALSLRLRADELAAGLDAWTGGWFSRHTAVR